MANHILVTTFTSLSAMLSPLAPGVGPAALLQTYDLADRAVSQTVLCRPVPSLATEPKARKSRAPASTSPQGVQWSLEVDQTVADRYFALRLFETPCGQPEDHNEPVKTWFLPTQVMDRELLAGLPVEKPYVVHGVPSTNPQEPKRESLKITRAYAHGPLTPFLIQFISGPLADEPEIKIWLRLEKNESPNVPWERFEYDGTEGEVRSRLFSR